MISTVMLQAFLATSVLAAEAPSPDDWPQFLGPTRDGAYRGTALLDSLPASGPKVLFQRPVGHGWSGPVVAAGRLVLFHRVDDKEVVECLEAESGKPIWKFESPTTYEDRLQFDDGPRATPAISGDRVYTFGAEGLLHALDLASGAKLWSVDTKKQFQTEQGWFGRACSPLVEGNAVLLNIGGAKGAGIVAFEKATGKVLWTATDDEASYSSPITASLGGRRQTLFLTRSALVSVDPSSGQVIFRYPFQPPIQTSVSAATPLVIGDLVFISASYQTGAALLRLKNGQPEKVWAADDVLSNHYATSVHRQGFLYGYDGRQESRPNLRCVDLEKGEVRWSEDRFGGGTILLAGDRLIIVTEKGDLVLAPADPKGFQPSARARILPGTVRAYPALAGGRLYVRNLDTLVCLDLRKG
jgi:outer membrane protein assembly factor BamB